jgi:hypothetical protein
LGHHGVSGGNYSSDRGSNEAGAELVALLQLETKKSLIFL